MVLNGLDRGDSEHEGQEDEVSGQRVAVAV